MKTWAMRGTLHLLPAGELGLWVAAQGGLKPRYEVGSWLRHHGLEREQAEAMLAAIPAALDGRQLTREELAGEVARITGIAGLDGKLRGGFGDLLKPASFRGLLCYGTSDGPNVRFTHPHAAGSVIRTASTIRIVRCSPRVARRYLHVHGPCHARPDFRRWWAGVTATAGAQTLIASLGDEVPPCRSTSRGRRCGCWRQTSPTARSTGPPVRGVRLLPAFDQYVIAATLPG